MVSPAWKNIGFQQENPLQDIRSGGTLAICNLDFFFRKYPDKVRTMCIRQQSVRLSSKYRRGYPFATASINVTRLVCRVFNLINKYGARQNYEIVKLPYWHLLITPDINPFRSVVTKANQPASGQERSQQQLDEEQVHLGEYINESLSPLHELYCSAFVLLDQEFRKADALNMEFNLILERTQELIEAALM